MSQTDPSPVVIPTFAQTLLHSLAQKAVTMAAAALIANGLIQPGQQDQFVSLGIGVLMFAGSVGWTWLRTRIDHKRLIAAAVAPPSQITGATK